MVNVEDLQALPGGGFWTMDTLRDGPEPNTVDETRPGYADLHARLGSLRGLMFTKAEVQLAALLGIWSGWTTAEQNGDELTHPVKFEQDIEIVISTTDASGRPTFATLILKAEWMNTHFWFHLFGHWVVKQYLKNALFTRFMSGVDERSIVFFCTPEAQRVLASASAIARYCTLSSWHKRILSPSFAFIYAADTKTVLWR
jgi:hypothetical protein